MKGFKTIQLIIFWGCLNLCLTGKAQMATKHNQSTKTNKSNSDNNPIFEQFSVDSTSNYTGKENKITDIVFRLPEVKSFARYLYRKTKGKRHLQILLAGYDKQKKCFWVKAGEDNGYMFVTHYNFYVYTNPTKIFYLDKVADKIVPLQEWRRQNGM